MIPFYINAFLIILVDAIIYAMTKDADKRRKYVCFLNTLQILLFVSLRGESVGNDTQNYVNYFRLVVNNPQSAFTRDVYEIGFRWYAYMIAKFTSDPRVFLAIGACISIIPLGIIIYKYSKDCTLSFYAFCTMEFILFAMTGMRQNVAYFFVYTSYILFQSERKIQKIFALVLVIAGGFFHRSAWAFLIIYLMALIKNQVAKKLVYIVGIFSAYIFRYQIGQIFVDRFFNAYQVGSTGAYSRTLIAAIVLLFSIIYYNTIIEQSTIDACETNSVSLFPSLVVAMFLTTFFFIIALAVSASARQGRYFFVFFTLLLPELQYTIVEDQRRLFKGVIYLLLTALMLYLFPHNGLCTYGYYFW